MGPKGRPVLLLAIAALCILPTALLPVLCKTLFVEVAGHFQPLAPSMAAALFIVFLFREDWARKLTRVLRTIIALSLIFIISVNVVIDGKYIGFLYFLLLQVATILILRDNQVKDFLKMDH